MGNDTDDGSASSREPQDPRLTPREDQLARNHAAVIDAAPTPRDPDPARAGMSERLTLRLKEVAATTGASLTTVRGWCSSGALVSVRIGGVVLVKPEDLTAFLDAHREGLHVTPLRHHARPRRKQPAGPKGGNSPQ